MKATTFLALKFLNPKGRSHLFSSLTVMTVLGVMVSVAAFLVVEAVMTGFSQDIRSKVLGFSAHLVLTVENKDLLDWEQLKAISSRPEVAGITHYLDGEAIVQTEEGDTQGLRVRGINHKFPLPMKDFQIYFAEGEGMEDLQEKGEKAPGILLGRELASSLGVVPFLSDMVELIYPLGEVGPTGELEPNLRRFRVIGRFKSGYYEYDSKFALVGLDQARRLLGDSGTEEIGIFLKDPFQALAFRNSLSPLSGIGKVRVWQEIHRKLFHVFRLERIGMGVVLGLMVLLASFNILSMLMMVVFQRRREIGVLKALGLSSRGVSLIFYRAGLWIALVGGSLGALIGFLVTWGLSKANLRLPAPYYIEHLPVEWNGGMILLAVLIALGMSLIATLVPAAESKRLTVVEAIRSE